MSDMVLMVLWGLSGLMFVFYLRRALTPATAELAPRAGERPSPPSESKRPAIKPVREPSLHLAGFVNGDTVNYVLTASKAKELERRGVTIGRDIWMSDFVVKDDHLSKRHARFSMENDKFVIEDLHSMNKTFLNGEALEPFEPRALSNHDKVRLGRLEFTVTLRPDSGGGAESRVQPYMIISIGRSDTNDYVLQSPSTSRRHGELIITDHQQYYLMDRSSGGGIKVYRDGDWRPLSAEFVLLEEWVAFSDDEVIQMSNILAQAGGRNS